MQVFFLFQRLLIIFNAIFYFLWGNFNTSTCFFCEILRIRAKTQSLTIDLISEHQCVNFHVFVQSSYLHSFWIFTKISQISENTSIHPDIHIKSVFFFVIWSLFYLDILSHPSRMEILACELNDQLQATNSQYERFANSTEDCGMLT